MRDKTFHTSYRSLLGSINRLQYRTQFQACYLFSRLASRSAAPTAGHCKELNILCEEVGCAGFSGLLTQLLEQQHKTFLNAWLRKEFAVCSSVQHPTFTQERL